MSLSHVVKGFFCMLFIIFVFIPMTTARGTQGGLVAAESFSTFLVMAWPALLFGAILVALWIQQIRKSAKRDLEALNLKRGVQDGYLPEHEDEEVDDEHLECEDLVPAKRPKDLLDELDEVEYTPALAALEKRSIGELQKLREQVRVYDVGPELDSLVAIHIMGWKMVDRRRRPLAPHGRFIPESERPFVWCGLRKETDTEMSEVPCYSSGDGHSMLILPVLMKAGYTQSMTLLPDGEWTYQAEKGDDQHGRAGPHKTVAECVVRGALRAVIFAAEISDNPKSGK